MTIHGKILAIFNLLGLVGLMCLMAMDFGKVRSWQYASSKADLMAEKEPTGLKVYTPAGLPLNEPVPGAVQTDDDRNLLELIGDPKEPTQILKELLPQGPYVNTQVKEVERVKGILDGTLQPVQNDKTKYLVLLCRYLTPLATSFEERERLILIRTNLEDEDKVKALTTALKQGFRPALERMNSDKALPPMAAKGDRRKRPFEQCYLEGVFIQGGSDKRPFVEKLLAVLPSQKGKKYDQAFADLGDMIKEDAFLQAVRNEPGKPFQELFDAAHEEVLAGLVTELKQRYEDHFQEALKGQRRPQGKPVADLLSPAEQRKAIARLLLNLVEVMPGTAGQQTAGKVLWDDPAYKRVIAVVGLQTFGKELERQAQLYQKMNNDLTQAIAQEHNDFALVHQDLLEKIKDRATQGDIQGALLQRIKDQADEKEKIVARRKEDVDVYVKDIDKERKETALRKDELLKMSDELFKIRVQVRDATRLNQEYQRQISGLEDRVR